MFSDSLEIKLTITAGGTDFTIPGANVKSFKVRQRPYGFKAEASFVISSEEETDHLFQDFVKPDLMKASMEISAHYHPENVTVQSLKISGLVTDKDLLNEQTVKDYKIEGDPVIYRIYRIVFADSAYVLWRQHFPSDLFTNKTMEDVFNAQKGSNVTLKYNWDDVLSKQYAITTLPLGTGKNEASFYDFAIWFVHVMNGVFTYDGSTDSYTMSQQKQTDGNASAINRQDISEWHVTFPETIRYNDNLLNSYTENPQNEQITQDQAVSGIRQDILVRIPVASDFDALKQQTTDGLKIRDHEIQLRFCQFPFISFNPGSLVKLEEGLWSKSIFPNGKQYRVQDLEIEGNLEQTDPLPGYNMTFAAYNVEMRAVLELKEETWVSLPSFVAPVFPIHVEGKIVSQQGEEADETYQIYQDETTSADQYHVAIPLWNNQEVAAPFEPYEFSGHFYFPGYKNQRVLVALFFHAARVHRFLDWRPGVRLPMDTQGNQLLLGINADSQTSLQHTYVDQKPVLNLTRTSSKDTQDIILQEGCLILEAKEDEG